ncbi:MAG: hypothetical protein ACRDYU_15965 [Actinomycetes bacterium]
MSVPAQEVADEETLEPALSGDAPAGDVLSGDAAAETVGVEDEDGQGPERRASRPGGRQRHDEKITVYISADDLFELEKARLTLRGEHRIAVDRGRIVREAVALALADLADKGAQSTLVQRLRSP